MARDERPEFNQDHWRNETCLPGGKVKFEKRTRRIYLALCKRFKVEP